MTWYDVIFTRDIPESLRVVIFGTPHLVWILICVVTTVMVYSLVARIGRQSKERAWRVTYWLGLACFPGWLVPVLFMCTFDTGDRWILNIPLHLCSASCLILPVAVLRRSKLLLNFSYGLGMPGAIMAIVTPGELYTHLAYVSIFYVFFNLTHLMIALVPLTAIAGGNLRPEWRYYPGTVAIGAALMVIVYPINKLLGTNYFFVNWPEPGSILELFAGFAGNPGYVFVLAVFAFSVVALLFALSSAIFRVKDRLSRSDATSVSLALA
jgi:hypothetical integral membrane protein (TIGR02206 family)